MEHRYGALIDALEIAVWLGIGVALVAVARWLARHRVQRILLANRGHGLVTTGFVFAFFVALQSSGPTDGFGAWNLVPIVLATSVVALALVFWGLIFLLSPAIDRRERILAALFTALAMLPVGIAVSVVFSDG